MWQMSADTINVAGYSNTVSYQSGLTEGHPVGL